MYSIPQQCYTITLPFPSYETGQTLHLTSVW